jgi:hypothetical protein
MRLNIALSLPTTVDWPALRQRVIGVVAAVAIVGILAQPTFIFDGFSGMTSAPVTPVPTTNAYGFSTALAELSPAVLNSKLDAMKATGAPWVRYDMSWDAVQSGGPTSYNWSDYDRVAEAIAARNMRSLVIIDFTPSWARESGCYDSKMCAPKSASAYASFAGQAVARYQHYGIRDWEIWNEPNISFRYHPAANPTQYVAILKASYRAIKSADPAAVVVTGGTAPSATDATNLMPTDFIKALYAAGASGSFDAVAAHPYTYPNSPADNLPLDAWGQLESMRRTMVANGDANKQIWITEFGAPTNGPDQSGDHVTEIQQSQILADALRIRRGYTWVGPFFWYEYQDDGTSTATSENFYGIVRSDGSHKPAYDIWTQFIRSVSASH